MAGPQTLGIVPGQAHGGYDVLFPVAAGEEAFWRIALCEMCTVEAQSKADHLESDMTAGHLHGGLLGNWAVIGS